MASKKKQRASARSAVTHTPKVSSLNGLRRAENVNKQIYRWIERKWPMDAVNAGEWLKFAAAMKASAALLESEALRIVNPSAFAPSRAEIIKSKRPITSADEPSSEE